MNWKTAIDTFEERRLAIWEHMPHDVYDLSNAVVPLVFRSVCPDRSVCRFRAAHSVRRGSVLPD